MFCCPRCSHLSTILNNIVDPESGVTTLFNIVDNCEQSVGSKVLFNPVFISIIIPKVMPWSWSGHDHHGHMVIYTKVMPYMDYLGISLDIN
jgi:hypothetical protein